jgi:hypothetical protein
MARADPASSSKEHSQGRSRAGDQQPYLGVQLYVVVAFASSSDVLEYTAGSTYYGHEDQKKRVRESGDNVDLKVKLGHKSHARVRVWSCSRANGTRSSSAKTGMTNRTIVVEVDAQSFSLFI